MDKREFNKVVVALSEFEALSIGSTAFLDPAVSRTASLLEAFRAQLGVFGVGRGVRGYVGILSGCPIFRSCPPIRAGLFGVGMFISHNQHRIKWCTRTGLVLACSADKVTAVQASAAAINHVFSKQIALFCFSLALLHGVVVAMVRIGTSNEATRLAETMTADSNAAWWCVVGAAVLLGSFAVASRLIWGSVVVPVLSVAVSVFLVHLGSQHVRLPLLRGVDAHDPQGLTSFIFIASWVVSTIVVGRAIGWYTLVVYSRMRRENQCI